LPWGINEIRKEGIVSDLDYLNKKALERVDRVCCTVEMQKVRDAIKNKIVNGRQREIPSGYSELRK
jgi:hypothetical protein